MITTELASKRQKEILKRELMSMLASMHVKKSGRILGKFAYILPL